MTNDDYALSTVQKSYYTENSVDHDRIASNMSIIIVLVVFAVVSITG